MAEDDILLTIVLSQVPMSCKRKTSNLNQTTTSETNPSRTTPSINVHLETDTTSTPSEVSVSTVSKFTSNSQSAIINCLAGELIIDIIQHMVKSKKVRDDLKKIYKN